MASIFSKIVAKEIPCFTILEDNEFLAFLDVNPLVKGHTLVIPKIEVDYFFDLNDDVLQRMIVFSKEVSCLLKESFPCRKIGVSIVGLEVPHAHIHLIPINSIDDMNFSNEKLKLSMEELSTIHKMITE
jgi:histidine triad (HIT) family protein